MSSLYLDCIYAIDKAGQSQLDNALARRRSLPWVLSNRKAATRTRSVPKVRTRRERPPGARFWWRKWANTGVSGATRLSLLSVCTGVGLAGHWLPPHVRPAGLPREHGETRLDAILDLRSNIVFRKLCVVECCGSESSWSRGEVPLWAAAKPTCNRFRARPGLDSLPPVP